MAIEWGDESNSDTDGEIQAYFYPQNGGVDYRLLWYGYGSLLSEVRLWWAPASDDRGTIMVNRDNSPNDLLLGGCDNASRVVKYVVVMGQGYDSSPLLDMRIHDINVEAEIIRNIPSIPEPEGVDGTIASVCEDPDNKFDEDTEQFADQALSVCWADSWWPTMEICLNALFGAILATVDLTIDILGTIKILSSDVAVSGVDFNDHSDVERISQIVKNASISNADTGLALSFWTGAVAVSSFLVINWATYIGIFLVVLLTWYTWLVTHVLELLRSLAQASITVSDALSALSSVVWNWVWKMIGFFIASNSLNDSIKNALTKVFGAVNASAMKAARWTMIISGLICLAGFVYLWGLISYSQPMNGIFVTPDWVK